MADSPIASLARESLSRTEMPPLDKDRAVASQLHVRALNTQFASWVQSQLKNHPDELWEDGVRDYLAHASEIMEKFSDVVNWLRVQSSLDYEPSLHAEQCKVFPEETCIQNSSSSLSKHQSRALFSNDQTAFFNGEEDELQQPSSPSVKRSEEKGIVVVHELKCKLYMKSRDTASKDTWSDRGTGTLYIKCKEGIPKGSIESKPTIIVRNDVGKVLLNALLYPGIKTSLQKNAVIAVFHTADGVDDSAVSANTFLIRTRNGDDRDKLAAVIREYSTGQE